MPLKRLIALVALGLTTCGIASAQFTGPAPVAWRWQQPTTVVPDATPAVNGDIIYVPLGQRVYAINRAEGNQVWRFPVGLPNAALFKGSPIYDNGTVYVISDNKILYALDATTGAQKWLYHSDYNFIGSPKLAGKEIIFEQSTGALMAVNAADGTPFYDSPLVVEDGVIGDFGVWNDDIIAFTSSNKIVAINVGTRKLDWSDQLTDGSRYGHPTVTSDTIYLTVGGYLLALNPGNGREKFSTQMANQASFWPAASDEGVATISQDGVATFFGLDGKSGKSVDLQSFPIAAPSSVGGGSYVFPTANGCLNLVSADKGLLWSYPVRPIGGPQDEKPNSTNGAGGGKGNFGGGPGGGAGAPGGGAGAPGGTGGGSGNLNQNSNSEPTKIVTVQAVSPVVLSGTTLISLLRDGSMIGFDATNGVCLTPPTVEMSFPRPGATVSGLPPLALAFKIIDDASGVNKDTLKITIDGKPYSSTMKLDGIAVLRFGQSSDSASGSIDLSTSTSGKQTINNPILSDGTHTIVVTVADWMGNVATVPFIIHIDNTLPPVKDISTDPNNQPGGAGGKGGFGGGGGGASGGLGGG